MKKCFNSNFVKYLIILGILYVLLKIIPNPKLQKKDILLILIVVILTLAYFDYNNKPIDNFLNTSETHQEMKQEMKQEVTQTSKSMTNAQFNTMFEMQQTQDQTQDHTQDQTQDQTQEQTHEQKHEPLTKEIIEMKYYNMLINGLLNKGILSPDDIAKLKLKIDSNLFTLEEMIISLEKLSGIDNHSNEKGQHKSTKPNKSCKSINDDIIYNELLPMQMKTIGGEVPNTWSGNYTILNTDKWTVPMTRPPVCINTTPCPVCPSDNNTQNLTGLADWDNSRTVSNTTINQTWSKNQQNPLTA